MEDNYITLFPGEKRQIGIDLSHLERDDQDLGAAIGSSSMEREYSYSRIIIKMI